MRIDDLWGIYCPFCGSIIATSMECDCPVCGSKLHDELYFEGGILAENGYDVYNDDYGLTYMELGEEDEEEEDEEEEEEGEW